MQKYIIATVVSLLGAFHLLMIGLYLGPANLAKKELSRVVEAYVLPLFYQDWHLFSPNPGFQVTRVWVKCTDEKGKTGEWLDALLPFERAHYRNRLSSHGTFVHVVQKNAEDLMKEYYARKEACGKTGKRCREATLIEQTSRLPVYEMQVRFANDVCTQSLGHRAAATQTKVLRLTPRAYSHRDQKGRWDTVQQIEFAPLRRKG